MMTIFTTAKPFTGHNGMIQRNALLSWSLLQPKCQIILIGDDPGARDAARECGALHIPEVERTPQGIPLISDLFRTGQSHASSPWVCFANADVILMQDFADAIQLLAQKKKQFLAVGRRWNLDVQAPIEFAANWARQLRIETETRGELFIHDAIDYFVFPRGLYREIPKLAVGRDGWDNWMIYEARRKLVPVIDISRSVMVVHQNHDFGKFKSAADRREGEESRRNQTLVGRGFFDLRDTTHELAGGKIVPTWNKNVRWHAWRLALIFPGLRYALVPLSRIKNAVVNAIGR